MKILVLEDETPAAERLINLIAEIEPTAEIIGVHDSVNDGIEFLKKNVPDIIFSDIELADGLCFDIISKTDTNIPIIFTTAYNQYALRAFEANAIDYLLKPVKRSDLERALTRLKSRIGLKMPVIDYEAIAEAVSKKKLMETRRYLVKYGVKMFVVDPNKAAYFHSIQKSTFMVSPEGKTYPLDESLSTVENDLDTTQFFRINRNVILHIESIASMRTYSKGRVQVKLIPEYENEKLCIVSAERSPNFKKWLKRES